MSEGMDPLKSSKKSEAQLLELEGEIEHLKQCLRLLKSEERAELEAKEEMMKQNHEKIQKLQMEIDELQAQLQKGKLADEKILKKAFQKHPNEIGLIKGRTAHEVIDILEGRVFDLTKKRDALRYEVRKKENILAQMKEDLRDMERRCERDVDETDEEIVHRAREVENQYQELQMRILEMQQIERIYQEIQEKLASDLVQLPARLEELEKEYHRQQAEIEELVERERKARESRDKAKAKFVEVETSAQQARLEKERVMAEFSQVVEQKHAHVTDADQRRRASGFSTSAQQAEEELNQMKKEQEKQLEFYKAAFEQIKIATGVTDIEDAEKRFASQKAIKENLMDLKERTEKMLRDLKLEKQSLESRKETMLGGDLACPEKSLEEELAKWKSVYEEQKKRKEAAEIECKRISNTTAQVKMSLWHILQLMEHHLYGREPNPTMPDIPLTELAQRVKDLLGKVMEKLKGHDIEALLKQLKEEQPFLKKLEEEKLAEMVHRRKPKPPAVEEESSSDEEARKRVEMKKEAQSFADIKQKQKGRGRGLKL